MASKGYDGVHIFARTETASVKFFYRKSAPTFALAEPSVTGSSWRPASHCTRFTWRPRARISPTRTCRRRLIFWFKNGFDKFPGSGQPASGSDGPAFSSSHPLLDSRKEPKSPPPPFRLSLPAGGCLQLEICQIGKLTEFRRQQIQAIIVKLQDRQVTKLTDLGRE